MHPSSARCLFFQFQGSDSQHQIFFWHIMLAWCSEKIGVCCCRLSATTKSVPFLWPASCGFSICKPMQRQRGCRILRRRVLDSSASNSSQHSHYQTPATFAGHIQNHRLLSGPVARLQVGIFQLEILDQIWTGQGVWVWHWCALKLKSRRKRHHQLLTLLSPRKMVKCLPTSAAKCPCPPPPVNVPVTKRKKRFPAMMPPTLSSLEFKRIFAEDVNFQDWWIIEAKK